MWSPFILCQMKPAQSVEGQLDWVVWTQNLSIPVPITGSRLLSGRTKVPLTGNATGSSDPIAYVCILCRRDRSIVQFRARSFGQEVRNAHGARAMV